MVESVTGRSLVERLSGAMAAGSIPGVPAVSGY